MKSNVSNIRVKVFIALLLCLFLVAPNVQSQIKFTASTNETEIGSNDLVQITFKIENAASINKLLPPAFKDFRIVSGPNQQRNITIKDGEKSTHFSVSYILKPKRAGNLIIAPARAVVDGQEIASNSVEVKVWQQSSSPRQQSANSDSRPGDSDGANVHVLKPGEDIVKKIKENLLLKLESDKTSCYVGESVVVSFDLYTRLLSKSTITDAPSFNGFSVSEMDVSNLPEEVLTDGKKFSKYTLRKVQLFPLRAGNYIISPLHSSNTVSFISAQDLNAPEMDPVLKMMQDLGVVDMSPNAVKEKISLTSNYLDIHVKALPEEDKPQNFSGAVGVFSIHASLAKDTMTTDEIGELTITISGEGNFELITSPDVKWPENMENLDTKSLENIDYNASPLTGKKTFSMPFSVSKSGNLEIPSVNFSWFDPQTQKYHTAQTDPIKLVVLKGEKELPDTIHYDDGGENTSNIFKLTFFVIIGLLLATGIFVSLKRKKSTETETGKELPTNSNRDKKENVEKELRQIRESLNALSYQTQYDDSKDLLKQLDKLLQQFFRVKLNIETQAPTHTQILQELSLSDIPQAMTNKAAEIFAELERNLYMGSRGSKTFNEIYDDSMQLVRGVDEE